MMGEVILSPDFPQHEIDRVRREHLTDLRRSKDEPNVIAERLVAGLVYPSGSGYAHPVGGTRSIGAGHNPRRPVGTVPTLLPPGQRPPVGSGRR